MHTSKDIDSLFISLMEFLTKSGMKHRWYIRSVSRLPEGLCVMLDSPWEDGRHTATASLRHTKQRGVFLLHETCDMGPETSARAGELEKRLEEALVLGLRGRR